ncbi:hypothetical protein M404DRAFT_327814 [Pisolithus tinctorius Marx 270]|uniref:Uncharacterized protein n=1 Tax=Pisolithus tinctorius Marx 270 TaxID=870435 RepID=A0A0C3KGY1_PISTI|nr:hypothetical protein M404DRAFT_327814 [Pisolithus tinctorius Marx 270]
MMRMSAYRKFLEHKVAGVIGIPMATPLTYSHSILTRIHAPITTADHPKMRRMSACRNLLDLEGTQTLEFENMVELEVRD